MELTESHDLPVSQQRAWEALNDMAVLKACIPGCENIEAAGEHAWTVSMAASVGPVKARFKGRMMLTDLKAPDSYTIVFEGQGGAAGFGKGSTQVLLTPAGDEATTLSYTATAQVGGKLAQIGSRLVDGAARKIAAEFFRRLGEQLGGGASGVQESPVDKDAEASPAREADVDAARADALPNAAAETDASDATRAEAGAADPQDAQKGKRSWTAWISKS